MKFRKPSMTYQEFDSKFKNQVSKLSYQQQLQLVLDICKKLFFDYQRFYDVSHWGNPDILLDAIRIIEYSKIKGADKTLLATTIEKVKKVTPDTEDFEEANYALDACVAIYYTLNFLLESKSEFIYAVGMSLYDATDAKVQEDNDLTEEEINLHPIMVEARRYLLRET